MLRAIIFDFNGVILDDEPLHARLMQQVVGEIGIDLTIEEYYRKYLPFDDRHCLKAILSDRGRTLEPDEFEALLAQKSRRYSEQVLSSCGFFPGSVEFIQSTARRYPIAIASGALRKEVTQTLLRAGVAGSVEGIIAAEDVVASKPNPEAFLKAHALLARRRPDLLQQQCLVVEDSVQGIDGAHAAGMKVAALAHTYPPEKLRAADLVARNWSELSLAKLEGLF